jgi:hypothetical protein
MRPRFLVRASALVVLSVIAAGCTSRTETPVPTASAASSVSPSAAPPSARALPSLDEAARDRIHEACVAADKEIVARGGRARIGDGFTLEAATEQGGRWVLLYGDGGQFATCMQRQVTHTGGAADFYLSTGSWAAAQVGALSACTNYAADRVFYCVGQTDVAAVQVLVDTPDAHVEAIPSASGHFVVSFPYKGAIVTDGNLGGRVQVSFFDACGRQFLPVMIGSMTPCPRPR